MPLDEPDPDLNRKVRQLVPNAVVVYPELPRREVTPASRPGPSAGPLELYRAYHGQRHGQAPTLEVEEAFDGLYQEVGG